MTKFVLLGVLGSALFATAARAESWSATCESFMVVMHLDPGTCDFHLKAPNGFPLVARGTVVNVNPMDHQCALTSENNTQVARIGVSKIAAAPGNVANVFVSQAGKVQYLCQNVPFQVR